MSYKFLFICFWSSIYLFIICFFKYARDNIDKFNE